MLALLEAWVKESHVSNFVSCARSLDVLLHYLALAMKQRADGEREREKKKKTHKEGSWVEKLGSELDVAVVCFRVAEYFPRGKNRWIKTLNLSNPGGEKPSARRMGSVDQSNGIIQTSCAAVTRRLRWRYCVPYFPGSWT